MKHDHGKGEAMELNASELIILIARQKGITRARIAEAIGCTPQNFSIRLKRNTWTPQELDRIAEALGCEFVPMFKDQETGRVYQGEKSPK